MGFGEFAFFAFLVVRWAIPVVILLVAIGWAIQIRRRIEDIAHDVRNLTLQLESFRPRPPA